MTTTYTPGEQIQVTASNPIFDDLLIGRQIWQKYDANGDGGGRALITAFIDASNVVAEILSNFTLSDDVTCQNWYLTAREITGLNYLEGETVGIIADGGVHADKEVSHGKITLDQDVSKAWVGYHYRGTLTTLNQDPGGANGSAQAKSRNIPQFMLRFLNSLGGRIGATLYTLADLVFRNTEDKTDRPPPLYSGNYRQSYQDNWELLEKHIVVIQDEPLPMTLTSIDVAMRTAEHSI